MAEPSDTDKTGAEAEATELGKVVAKLLDSFEQMDLPESIQDARVIIFADTENEGIAAGSENYTDYRDAVTNALGHVKVMLRQVGIDMDVVSGDAIKAMLGQGSN